MLKVGQTKIKDNGLAVSVENIAGVNRQVLMIELSGGITAAALAALCNGPIEVVDDAGNTEQGYEGPFRLVSHRLMLTRENEGADVAELTAKIAALEAELAESRSEKATATAALESIREELTQARSSLAVAAKKAVPQEETT